MGRRESVERSTFSIECWRWFVRVCFIRLRLVGGDGEIPGGVRFVLSRRGEDHAGLYFDFSRLGIKGTGEDACDAVTGIKGHGVLLVKGMP
jgi:hypothetical protein